MLWYTYRKHHGKCVGSWLLLWYAISSVLTVWENFTTPINSEFLDPTATAYYVCCQLIALAPFLYLGKYDCRSFRYSPNLFYYLAIILIFFGLYKLIVSCVELSRYSSVLFGNIENLRYSFYDTFLETKSISSFQKVTIIVEHFQYMSPFIMFYFLAKNRKRLAVLLFIASLSMPMAQIVNGEREGVLRYLVLLYTCYVFYSPILPKRIISEVKKVSYVVIVPFAIFIVAMTIGRFGGLGSEGFLHSIFLYGGDQPFLFTTFFYESDLRNQLQGGRVNFQYFFSPAERVQGQINLYIDSDIYLNQFAGMPGSFFLDFGFYTIFVIFIISFIYYMIIGNCKRINNKYPLHVLFLFYFSFQVLYMNIFYFDFHSLFYILFSVIFYIVCYFYTGYKETLDFSE